MRVSSQLGVSEGRVSCPLQKTQVNAEECLGCRSFRGIKSGNTRTGVIVCKSEMPDLLLSPLLYGSLYGATASRQR